MKLRPITEADYRSLFEVIRMAESFGEDQQFDAFAQLMRNREGFVVCNTKGYIVGQIAYSNFVPAVDLQLHASVLPKYQGRWLTRAILKQVFEYPFVHLDLPRLSSYSIRGLTDKAGETLKLLGFKKEGEIEGGFKTGGKYYNLILYGMKREKCRWL